MFVLSFATGELPGHTRDHGGRDSLPAQRVQRGDVFTGLTSQERPDHTSFIQDMSDAELAEFIRQNAGDVLQALDERNAPARKTRH